MKNETANKIASQLGFTLKMVGAKNLIAYPDALAFRIGTNPKKVNHLKIILDTNDTYSMTFSKVPSVRQICAGKDVEILADVSGVFVSNLKDVIKTHTGLETRF